MAFFSDDHQKKVGAGGHTAMTAAVTPRVADLDLTTCTVVNQTDVGQTFNKSLVRVRPEEFLCKYETHCLNLCMCCDFLACDCQMSCPEGCHCYHDTPWSVNIVQCSRGSHSEVPALVPMDATALHLDNNNLTTLKTGMFLGKIKDELDTTLQSKMNAKLSKQRL